MKVTTLQDRYLGALRGLAVGDALGAPVEFLDRGTFPWIDSYAPAPRFRIGPGVYTDDTIMAIAMAEALIEAQGYDSYKVMDNYSAWYNRGKYTPNNYCFDIGMQTMFTIKAYDWNPVVKKQSQRTESAGNGVLMRFAPIAIVTHAQRVSFTMGDKLAALSAKDTHYSHEAEEATIIFGRLLRAIFSGAPKSQILQASGSPQDSFELRALLQKTNNLTRDDVIGSGYVRESLQAAWWCFMHTDNFKDAIEAAVNLGLDADTTAAITGQLAGAYYGDSAIPAILKDGLWQTEQFPKIAAELQSVPAVIVKSRFESDEEFQSI